MSAATELDWDWGPECVPESVPVGRPASGRLATVTALHRPPEQAVAPQLRLTRRGVHVVAAAVAVLAVALVALARVSASSAGPVQHRVPDTVTVRAGDTLWSIAGRVAPGRDPRVEIADLQRLNSLSGVALEPGQVLRTH
jgi:Tfp pilus assembly protein FimV